MIEKIHSQINFPTKLRISFPETKVTKKSLEVEEFNYLQNSNLRFLIDISQKKAICFFLKIHPSRSSKEALKEETTWKEARDRTWRHEKELVSGAISNSQYLKSIKKNLSFFREEVEETRETNVHVKSKGGGGGGGGHHPLLSRKIR